MAKPVGGVPDMRGGLPFATSSLAHTHFLQTQGALTSRIREAKPSVDTSRPATMRYTRPVKRRPRADAAQSRERRRENLALLQNLRRIRAGKHHTPSQPPVIPPPPKRKPRARRHAAGRAGASASTGTVRPSARLRIERRRQAEAIAKGNQHMANILSACKSAYDSQQWAKDYGKHVKHLRLACRDTTGQHGFVKELMTPTALDDGDGADDDVYADELLGAAGDTPLWPGSGGTGDPRVPETEPTPRATAPTAGQRSPRPPGRRRNGGRPAGARPSPRKAWLSPTGRRRNGGPRRQGPAPPRRRPAVTPRSPAVSARSARSSASMALMSPPSSRRVVSRAGGGAGAGAGPSSGHARFKFRMEGGGRDGASSPSPPISPHTASRSAMLSAATQRHRSTRRVLLDPGHVHGVLRIRLLNAQGAHADGGRMTYRPFVRFVLVDQQVDARTGLVTGNGDAVGTTAYASMGGRSPKWSGQDDRNCVEFQFSTPPSAPLLLVVEACEDDGTTGGAVFGVAGLDLSGVAPLNVDDKPVEVELLDDVGKEPRGKLTLLVSSKLQRPKVPARAARFTRQGSTVAARALRPRSTGGAVARRTPASTSSGGDSSPASTVRTTDAVPPESPLKCRFLARFTASHANLGSMRGDKLTAGAAAGGAPRTQPLPLPSPPPFVSPVRVAGSGAPTHGGDAGASAAKAPRAHARTTAPKLAPAPGKPARAGRGRGPPAGGDASPYGSDDFESDADDDDDDDDGDAASTYSRDNFEADDEDDASEEEPPLPSGIPRSTLTVKVVNASSLAPVSLKSQEPYVCLKLLSPSGDVVSDAKTGVANGADPRWTTLTGCTQQLAVPPALPGARYALVVEVRDKGAIGGHVLVGRARMDLAGLVGTSSTRDVTLGVARDGAPPGAHGFVALVLTSAPGAVQSPPQSSSRVTSASVLPMTSPVAVKSASASSWSMRAAAADNTLLSTGQLSEPEPLGRAASRLGGSSSGRSIASVRLAASSSGRSVRSSRSGKLAVPPAVPDDGSNGAPPVVTEEEEEEDEYSSDNHSDTDDVHDGVVDDGLLRVTVVEATCLPLPADVSNLSATVKLAMLDARGRELAAVTSPPSTSFAMSVEGGTAMWKPLVPLTLELPEQLRTSSLVMLTAAVFVGSTEVGAAGVDVAEDVEDPGSGRVVSLGLKGSFGKTIRSSLRLCVGHNPTAVVKRDQRRRDANAPTPSPPFVYASSITRPGVVL